jgi:hypothetical protein
MEARPADLNAVTELSASQVKRRRTASINSREHGLAFDQRTKVGPLGNLQSIDREGTPFACR